MCLHLSHCCSLACSWVPPHATSCGLLRCPLPDKPPAPFGPRAASVSRHSHCAPTGVMCFCASVPSVPLSRIALPGRQVPIAGSPRRHEQAGSGCRHRLRGERWLPETTGSAGQALCITHLCCSDCSQLLQVVGACQKNACDGARVKCANRPPGLAL